MISLSASRRLFDLAILSTLAIAQPLFDLLQKGADFFLIRRSNATDVVFLVIAIIVIIPVALLFLEQAVRLISRTLSTLVHAFLVGLFCTLIAAPLLKGGPIADWTNSSIAIYGGLLTTFFLSAWAYMRSTQVRTFLAFLSPAVLIVPGFFFSQPRISGIVFPQRFLVAEGEPARSPITTVLVVFDELPLISLLDDKREIDPIRFPNFRKLADTSYFFSNTTTVSAYTQHAVPAILTGNYPGTTGLKMPWLRDHPQNLFTLLAPSHRLNAYEQETRLCPPNLCPQPNELAFLPRSFNLLQDVGIVFLHIVLPNNLAATLPSISTSWGDFRNDDNPQQKKRRRIGRKGFTHSGDWADDAALFQRFTDSITASPEPRLHFLHVTFPHVPYRYFPDGTKYELGLDARNDHGYRGKWDADVWPTLLQYQRHLLQLGYADALLGTLLDKLKAEGLFDDAAVIVTADHGTSFSPNEFARRTSAANAAEVMLVPLLVKLPKQQAARLDRRNAETVDILPTICDLNGVSLTSPVSGVSLIGHSEAKREKRFYELDKSSHSQKILAGSLDLGPALDRKLTYFGHGAFSRVFSLNQEKLIGKTSLEVASGSFDGQIEIDDPGRFRQVKPRDKFLPALITGRVRAKGLKNQPVELGVLVNGKVVTLTRTLSSMDDVAEFRAITPREAWRDGANDVAIIPLAPRAVNSLLE